MKAYLHIKGKILWRACACLLIGIVLACCGEVIESVDQPATAKVGDVVPIKVHVSVPTAGDPSSSYLVFGFLVPKGWKAAQNTTVRYESTGSGNGNMTLIPNSTLPKNGGGLNWPAYMKKFFGIGGNLIDDMEWVVYQSNTPFSYSNGYTFSGDIIVNIKVGADNNNTTVKLGYAVTDASNELTSNQFGTYYSELVPPTCVEVTGGTGDLVDFCNPQLTFVDPPKSLDNDFVTLTYDGNVVTTPLNGESDLYLCATAYTNDGKTIQVCEQTNKSHMIQTSATSKRFQLTFWPKSFFNVTDKQTITKMEYFVTNKAGSVKVGYGNTLEPFVYTFKCE